MIRFEQLDGPFVDAADLLTRFVSVTFDEVFEQHRDVLPPLAQRRHFDREHVQTIEQVEPEIAGGDGLLQIPIGGGDDADISGNGLAAADSFKLPFLEHSKEGDLSFRRKLGNFVQEKRAALSQLKSADAPLLLIACGLAMRSFD